MNLKFIKRGVVLTTLATTLLVPFGQTLAAEQALALPQQNNKSVMNRSVLMDAVSEAQNGSMLCEEIKIETGAEIVFREMFRDKAFAILEEDEDYLIVKAEADEQSEWLGKVQADTLLQVIEKDEEYALVSSGNLEGYINIEDLALGREAAVRAKELLEAKFEDTDVITLDEETIMESFGVAETREEELARLEAEKAKRIAEEKARIEAEKAKLRAKGQSVVSYAKRFLGNPYVYGGTSLTRGTDCSGFVMRVYQNFGISLPRTSYSMRYVGKAVSYSEMMPGDIVCYSGHVGIYAGNGQIVNAIDSAHGIGMSNVNYAPIITIRRMY